MKSIQCLELCKIYYHLIKDYEDYAKFNYKLFHSIIRVLMPSLFKSIYYGQNGEDVTSKYCVIYPPLGLELHSAVAPK